MRRYSPYNHAFNNPLRFVDPDGMAPTDIIIKGPQAQAALTELGKETNLKLSLGSNGLVQITGGKATTTRDKELQAAITDHSVEVNLNTTTATSITLPNGNLTGDLVVGAYGGSKNEVRESFVDVEGEDIPVSETVTVTDQHINMSQASKESQVGGVSTGQNVYHETMESYYAGKSNPGDSPGANSKGYLPAHNKAIKNDPNYKNMNYKQDPATKKYSVENPSTGQSVNL